MRVTSNNINYMRFMNKTYKCVCVCVFLLRFLRFKNAKWTMLKYSRLLLSLLL